MLPFLPILEIELHFELQHIWDITREREEQLQSAESLITPVMTARDVPVGKKGFTLAQNTHSYLLSVLKGVLMNLMHQNHLDFFLITDFEAPLLEFLSLCIRDKA